MMDAAKFEQEIHSLLMQHSSSDACRILCESLVEKDLQASALAILGNFCLYSGEIAPFQKFCQLRIENKKAISWAHFAESFALQGNLSEVFANFLIEACEESNQLDDLARSSVMQGPQLELQRQMRVQKIADYGELRKKEWLDQAHVLASQGLLDEQQKFLQLALAVDGENPLIKAQLRAVEQQKAQNKMDRRKTHALPSHSFWEEPKSNSEKEALKCIEKSLRDYLQQSKENDEPQTRKDFAMMLMHFGGFEEALLHLAKLPPETDVLWLQTEILFRKRLFLELLQHLDFVETKLALDPATTPLAIYYRSRALWELHEKSSAFQLLESLVNAQPDFLSGMNLLLRWKRELE